jgi:hypothetical protein
MTPLQRVAQSIFLDHWATMNEIQRDIFTLVIIVITRRKIGFHALFKGTDMKIMALSLAISFVSLVIMATMRDIPAPVFLGAGFFLGCAFFLAVALAILKSIKNSHNGK